MTPPPAAALLDTALPGAPTARRADGLPRPRRRPVTLVRPDWSCDNCETANPGRRRRCADCGTTRV